MVTLLVDFNRLEKDGRLPALLPTGTEPHELEEGEKVVASDDEGTECWAIVDDVQTPRVVMLRPYGETWRDSVKTPPVGSTH